MMSYRPGYTFQVAHTLNAVRELVPTRMYDRPWDHTLTPDENRALRKLTAELDNGETVTVVTYDKETGALLGERSNGMRGYVG